LLTFEDTKDGFTIGGVSACLDEGNALAMCSLWSIEGLEDVGYEGSRRRQCEATWE
jgi:hypothetical protein